MSGWQIREARHDDGAGIEQFMTSVKEFEGTITPGDESHVWDWLFLNDRSSPELSILAEDSAGKVVAHYGIAPFRYELEGAAIKAGIACKLAIDEKYRKEPLFVRLITKALKDYPSKGIRFVQGLVNRPGLLEFHQAFGYKNLGSISIYVKPLKVANLTRLVLPGPVHLALWPMTKLGELISRAGWRVLTNLATLMSRDYRIQEVAEGFDPSLDFGASVLRKYHRIFGERTAAHLNWRYCRTAFRKYRTFVVKRDGAPIGYFVLRLMDMKGVNALGIVDICFDFEKADLSRYILSYIDRVALDEGADAIAILANSKPLLKQLSKRLYIKSPESCQLIVHEPRKDSLNVTRFPLDDWYVTWFDHDYV